MNLSVILCTYNRAAQLETALRSLAAVRVPRDLKWQLLVVDNNSTDATKAVVAAAATHHTLPCQYLFEARQGKSYALNTGVTNSTGDVVAFCDDDVTFHPEWLVALCRAFENADCAGIGGRIVPVWLGPKPRWYADDGPHRLLSAIVKYEFGDAAQPVLQPPYGANMAFRRSVLTRYGGFDPRLGPSGQTLMRGEDTELGRRLIEAGERVLYWPDAIVYHPVEQQRLRKAYFLSFYYHFGRMQVRTSGVPSQAIRWLGVPRYMIRGLLDHGFQWLVARGAQERFYHRLECARELGSIVECYRQMHEQQALRAHLHVRV